MRIIQNHVVNSFNSDSWAGLGWNTRLGACLMNGMFQGFLYVFFLKNNVFGK